MQQFCTPQGLSRNQALEISKSENTNLFILYDIVVVRFPT